MGTLLTSTIGTGASLVTASATLNEDGSVNKKSRDSLLVSTLTTTATIVSSAIISEQKVNEIYEKYSSAYMESATTEELENAQEKVEQYIAYLDSLSDDELVKVLEKQGQLQSTSEAKKIEKTI